MLDRFRSHEVNLLVCTNVGSEGGSAYPCRLTAHRGIVSFMLRWPPPQASPLRDTPPPPPRNLVAGMDFPQCNLVFTAAPPKTLIDFIQWRGRARKRDSAYLLMQSRAAKDKNGGLIRWVDP